MKRQIIIDELDAKLKEITIDNGYLTNAGLNVYPWRQEELQSHELPGIIYIDNIAGRRPGPHDIFIWALNVEIYCFVAASDSTAIEMRNLIQDVFTAIGKADKDRWKGQAIRTELAEGSEMVIERKGKTAGSAIVNITIVYDMPKWKM